MITQAGQVVVQLADNIMVGHVGTAQLAGVSFANAIFLIGFITLLGFSQGLTPLVGESYAKGDHKKASHLLQSHRCGSNELVICLQYEKNPDSPFSALLRTLLCDGAGIDLAQGQNA